VKNLPLETIRNQAEAMEHDSQRFYMQAAAASQDVSVRKLLGDLAIVEQSHGAKANALSEAILTESARDAESATAHRFFVLQFVQPGLAGLMDGSVSTLAPLFAAAFATHNNFSTLLVGLAAAVGAGISMAFAEALSDDGSITGRGAPYMRGAVCGLMTTLGGLGHALPYLVPDSWPHAFWTATGIAGAVVFVELWVIAYIRARYMDTSFLKAIAQIVVGGAIVLLTGILIGAA
jgi:rubrerythrin